MVTGPWPAARPRRFLLACCATLILLASAAAAAQAAQVEAPSYSLQVWNLNTHPVAVAPDTPTDYFQFINYITDPARVPYIPDIVTLQEAGTLNANPPHPSCQDFVSGLEARTGPPPSPLGPDYDCLETKKSGGAAIVYNTTRLTRPGSAQEVWLYRIDGGGVCRQSEVYAIVLRLRDDHLDQPKEFVNVGSVHLPNANFPESTTRESYWAPDCVMKNMGRTSPAVTSLGSAQMQIMAGDWNHVDASAPNGFDTFGAWECWYSAVNTPDLGGCAGDSWGWKDAMYRQCKTTPDAATYSCLHNNHWSYGAAGARIDFLFAKAYAVYNQVTVPFPDARTSSGSPPGAPNYSDHRGQGALLRYYPPVP